MKKFDVTVDGQTQYGIHATDARHAVRKALWNTDDATEKLKLGETISITGHPSLLHEGRRRVSCSVSKKDTRRTQRNWHRFNRLDSRRTGTGHRGKR